MEKFRAFGGIPVKRTFRGIFEITQLLRELIGEEDVIANIPDRIDLKAVTIRTGVSQGSTFSVCGDEDKPVFLRVIQKDKSTVRGILHCGDICDDLVKGSFSFDMYIDLFCDVRRIDEFEGVVKGGDGNNYRQTVYIADLRDRGIQIAILKEYVQEP